MTEEQRKRGRPKGGYDLRDTRVSGYLTKEDAEQVRAVAEAMGFSSTSELVTAIFERLCIGGFSAMVFAKLGWQFATALSKKKIKGGLYWGLRPLPPLLGDEPSEEDISKHLTAVRKEVKEKGIGDGSPSID